MRWQLSHPALNKNRKGKGQNIQSQISHQNTILENVLLIHDHARNLWFDRKWFAKLSHDISMVQNYDKTLTCVRLIHFEWVSSILLDPVFPLNGRLGTNADIRNLIYGYEKISSAYSPSPIDTLFFIKNHMLLWSVGGFVSLLKHAHILVKEHRDYFSLRKARTT